MDRLITFPSVHQALRGERSLGQAGVRFRGLPTPRIIDRSCGQALLFAAVEEAVVLGIFAKQSVEWGALFAVERTGETTTYQLVAAREERHE